MDDPRLRWGKTNTIAVRVFDSNGGGGMYDQPFQVTVKGLKDYLMLNMNPKPTENVGNGLTEKTISLKNVSSFPVIKGTLKMELTNADTKQVITTQTLEVELRNEPNEYTIRFAEDMEKRLVAHYTFTESKTKNSVFYRYEFPYILTPKTSDLPKINGAKVFGVRPGSPLLFRIPATGLRPITFTAENLPTGLILDAKTGIITGNISQKGTYGVRLKAANAKGTTAQNLTIVVGDRIALTPPMGWNSWNCFGLSVDQEKVKTTADLFIHTGLADHGWTYINIDDGWQTPGEKFPDMKALNEYIHRYGLKTGIYSSPGPQTCGTYQGSFQKEEKDARTWANWGFDYLKYDWCSYAQIARGDGSLKTMQRPYKIMQEALLKQKRDMVYSLCQYGMGDVWVWGDSVGGQTWRTTGDILDHWESMSQIGFNQEAGAPYAKPGNWNDPDMLVVGWVGLETGMHYTHLTVNEQYTHISLWSLLAAPLLIGCDLTKLDNFTLSLLTNDEVIAVDQDPLGKQGTAAFKNSDYQIIVKDVEDGSKVVGLFNLTENDLNISAPWTTLRIKGKHLVRDLWRQKDLGYFQDKFDGLVPPHGVVLIKLTKQQDHPLHQRGKLGA